MQQQQGTPDFESGDQNSREERKSNRLALDIALYTVARFGLLAVLAGVLVLFRVPLLVALAVAVVVAMPLSLVIFSGLRRRVAEGMAERSRVRRERKERLRAQLRGTADPSPVEPDAVEPDSQDSEPDRGQE
ncbi:DUF4229 domain-containing protein [Actinopolyspora saharensis]|uniref:DUF4229 domain-containing protein n=1 Tax=Actinopolyspora saharensis TaxID=995062 RepID=A0A1H1GCY6_9ACTN|nr:DUF4229 domain-containing protein [Actinopolyspora saharensis]SDR11031.1 Protein of unknown function [Actinopolyspora saharensis]